MHSISVKLKSRLWLGHSKILILFLLSHWEVDLLMCLGSLPCCKTQLRLRLQTDGRTFFFRIFERVQNSWFHQLWVVQVLKLQNNPRPSHYHHHVWLLVWCCLFFKCCVGFAPDVTKHASSKKFNFCLISPQNICPKVLGIIKIFFGKCEMSFCVLFGQQWLLPRNSPMDAVFAQSLSYCWIMNTDLNWSKWGLQFI